MFTWAATWEGPLGLVLRFGGITTFQKLAQTGDTHPEETPSHQLKSGGLWGRAGGLRIQMNESGKATSPELP